MISFNKVWLRSKARRKQRKFRFNAPLHVRRKLMSANLSEELQKDYGRRSFPVRIGDKVKVMRGEFKNIIGKVEGIDAKNMKAFVTGAERSKGEGQPASKYPIDASNLKIITLNLDDKMRKAALERTVKKAKKEDKK